MALLYDLMLLPTEAVSNMGIASVRMTYNSILFGLELGTREKYVSANLFQPLGPVLSLCTERWWLSGFDDY